MDYPASRVQALCFRNFFGGFSAEIDEIRKFQLSGCTDHICYPTSGHQILYLLRRGFFRGSSDLTFIIFHANFVGRLSFLLTAERIGNRRNKPPF
jgi:hypothetical protein